MAREVGVTLTIPQVGVEMGQVIPLDGAQDVAQAVAQVAVQDAVAGLAGAGATAGAMVTLGARLEALGGRLGALGANLVDRGTTDSLGK